MTDGCRCATSQGRDPASRSGPGEVTRRGVLAGSVAVLTAVALTGCGSDEPDPTGSSPAGGTPAASPSATPYGSASAAASGTRLAGTDEFPVGGGKVVTTGTGVVVVTHPADDVFKAFTGKCPHQGCPVTEVTENVILCQCHGSTFDGDSGERLDGPAPRGLAPLEVRVEGDGVYLA